MNNRRTPAGALAARHPARLVTIAVAMIACLAMALTGLSPAPARAAASSPQPQQPVTHYLPHLVPVSLTQLKAQTTATSFHVYYICLSNADTHCLGTEAASSERADGIEQTIVDAILGHLVGKLVDVLWRIISGSDDDVTAEDEGDTGGTEPSAMVGKCLGANPTKSDGNDRVYPSFHSKCFGILRESWTVVFKKGSTTEFHLVNRQAEAEGRDYELAQLNLREGAFLYVKPSTQSGLWTTWSLYLPTH
jgi:hypothetical protein